MFLDAAGVIALPHRGLVRDALAGVGVGIDPDAVAPAHYAAVRALDRATPVPDLAATYLPALCTALGVASARRFRAVGVLTELADRSRSGRILWSEPAPGALATMEALARAGLAVVVVTNSDGHAAENLRDAGICQIGPGEGASVLAVVDSARVGSAKPDHGIFEAALRRAGTEPGRVVHVGDGILTDVVGARAAGIAPIHLDPLRRCRDPTHRHVRSLCGLRRHIDVSTTASPITPDPAAATSSLRPGQWPPL